MKNDPLHGLDDDLFDSHYPSNIRSLSAQHWTPVSIAQRAARFLVKHEGARILDIGCGPGKFCVVGALTTNGLFTGVEQREDLVVAARELVERTRVHSIEIVHANILEIEFSQFDAFYLYNPFAEHLTPADRIDSSIVLSKSAHRKYSEYVTAQLAATPAGTRLACYWTDFDGAAIGFELQNPAALELLKLWEKRR